jgi:hypothetical protein
MTALLLPFKDIDTNFIDYSANNHTITRYGDVTQTTAQSKWYSRSAYFDGDGDYLTFQPSFNFGSGDFTVEFWFRQRDLINRALICARDSGDYSALFLDVGSSKVRVFSSSGGSWQINLISTTNIAADTWYHVAYTRSGDTFRLFLNGNLEASGTSSITLINFTNPVRIGSDALRLRVQLLWLYARPSYYYWYSTLYRQLHSS